MNTQPDNTITRAEVKAINKTLNTALILIAQAMTDVLILENKLRPQRDFNVGAKLDTKAHDDR